MKLGWNLTDFRAWWESAARRRWLRMIRRVRSRDLANFGDVV